VELQAKLDRKVMLEMTEGHGGGSGGGAGGMSVTTSGIEAPKGYMIVGFEVLPCSVSRAWLDEQRGVHDLRQQGEAVQLETMKPVLEAPGIKRLKLNCDELISNFAFKFNLRRYNKAWR
jgi:hypothetical protein